MDTIRQKMALGIIVAVLLISSISASFQPIKAQSSMALAPCPGFDSSKFSDSTDITNRYLPMKPGTIFVYPGTINNHPQVSIVSITHQTRMIDNVMTIVVN